MGGDGPAHSIFRWTVLLVRLSVRPSPLLPQGVVKAGPGHGTFADMESVDRLLTPTPLGVRHGLWPHQSCHLFSLGNAPLGGYGDQNLYTPHPTPPGISVCPTPDLRCVFRTTGATVFLSDGKVKKERNPPSSETLETLSSRIHTGISNINTTSHNPEIHLARKILSANLTDAHHRFVKRPPPHPHMTLPKIAVFFL